MWTAIVLAALAFSPSLAGEMPNPSPPCLCQAGPDVEPCGVSELICRCVGAPSWARLRFWVPEAGRCEEVTVVIEANRPGQAGSTP